MAEFNKTSDDVEETPPPSILVKDLTFGYKGLPNAVLKNLDMTLAPGARCLLIGANGSGKSTLLRLLAGRHMAKPDGAIMVLNQSAFHSTKLNFERAYLDTEWGLRTVAFAGYGCPLQADIPVHGMMKALQAQYPERRDELIELLGIDLNWRMHQVSDGQRRRVQIFIGLIRPFKILLLDEVTVSLDVCVRVDLMLWLKKESETRGATIVYATHIFDGLDDWPTHLHYLTNEGCTGWQGQLHELELYREMRARGEPSPMLRIAETWLRAELKQRTAQGLLEQASGAAAHAANDPLQHPDKHQGGFSAGRISNAYAGVGHVV